MISNVRTHALWAILLAGLAAGALDITDAFVLWGLRGVAPTRILQSVAAGVLGRDAFQGGLPAAALGAVLHFFMTTLMATAYYAASLRWPVLVQRPILYGLTYGVGLFFVMHFVVVPLSAAPGGGGFPKEIGMLVNAIFCHTVLVGLPIALITRRALQRTAPRSVAA